MAKYYDRRNKEEVWSDCDIAPLIEEVYWELNDFLVLKRLDGHDRRDEWYMNVRNKLGELIDVLGKSPIDELEDRYVPLN